MTGHFQTRYGLLDPLKWNGLIGTVLEVRIDIHSVRYLVEFENGGATQLIPSEECGDP